MEFEMTNEILKVEEEILRDEEFLAAYDPDDDYFSGIEEANTPNKIFLNVNINYS